ncbi:hypothetical protein PM10SUCC1_11570 [Propionigenium maris DSM 9537]|uniref:HTH crp-type domain-containing protein n=1 Tax=Propionigenium maris DSM 9537 TaxID=1123000 RepID=A0A9W6GI60_9FUSO|nr:helix-turn-helix domain-containing protein [Propionigenium maris]GLI55643.1 hypothetical protein PM10SUCC1_11570 [Propionigenium maris DSM 9537]
MERVFKELKKYIPEDVLNNLSIKEYHKGDLFCTREDKNIYVVLKGTVRGIRFHGMNEIYYPFLFKPGDSIGFLYSLKPYEKNWEVVVVSKTVEVIVFNPSIIEKYIMNDLKAFKYFVLNTMDAVERGMTSFFLRIYGGSEALFAYGLVNNEDKGRVAFESYTNLAKGLGISRSMLYRIIKKFVREGLIQKEKNEIIIKNKRGLIDVYKKYTY